MPADIAKPGVVTLFNNLHIYTQWRMQDGNQGGAKTMETLIYMKI
jgi:hypothetical protein